MADLLLDTHALLWFLEGDRRMSAPARQAIDAPDSKAFVSAASAWEISTKHRIGKLPTAGAFAARISETIFERGFLPIAVTMQHAQLAGALPGEHKDPFDRMLIAQALLEGLLLVSNERAFDTFGVKRLW